LHFYSKITFLLLVTFLCSGGESYAQTDSLTSQRKAIRREVAVYSGIGIFYSGMSYGLYHAWYKGYGSGSFHFFNDNNEWMQMDKLGHAFSCYSEGVNGMNLLDYAGLPRKKATWIGGMMGFGMQTIVEFMDGYSSAWGFSWGDIGTNALGTALAISQRCYWDEQRIKLCYSVHSSDLREHRPELLGTNMITGILKDYNGLTGWLSVNLHSFAPETRIPPWLNIAVGYGAYGMLTGDPRERNIFFSKGTRYDYSYIERYRIFYLSPDINLQKIPFIKNHRTLLIISRFLSPLKFPLPTLQYDSKNGLRFRPIYF
jgi:uncharacterized protein YfiM (DUF2279 family)